MPSASAIGRSRLRFIGSRRFEIARIEKTASNAAAAPNKCPVRPDGIGRPPAMRIAGRSRRMASIAYRSGEGVPAPQRWYSEPSSQKDCQARSSPRSLSGRGYSVTPSWPRQVTRCTGSGPKAVQTDVREWHTPSWWQLAGGAGRMTIFQPTLPREGGRTAPPASSAACNRYYDFTTISSEMIRLTEDRSMKFTWSGSTSRRKFSQE